MDHSSVRLDDSRPVISIPRVAIVRCAYLNSIPRLVTYIVQFVLIRTRIDSTAFSSCHWPHVKAVKRVGLWLGGHLVVLFGQWIGSSFVIHWSSRWPRVGDCSGFGPSLWHGGKRCTDVGSCCLWSLRLLLLLLMLLVVTCWSVVVEWIGCSLFGWAWLLGFKRVQKAGISVQGRKGRGNSGRLFEYFLLNI